MPMRGPVQGSTLLRNLPYKSLSKLARLLDPPNSTFVDWRGLASRIPRKPGDDQLRYGPQEIAVFDLEYRRPGGSPTIALINDWGTVNATVQDLVSHLIDMGHLAAAEVILPGVTTDPNLNITSTVSSTTINQDEYRSGSAVESNYASNNPNPHMEQISSRLDSIQKAKNLAQQTSHESRRLGDSGLVSSSTESCSVESQGEIHSRSTEGQRSNDSPVSTSVPVESSDLPDFEPDKVKEYSYNRLSFMTDSFNNTPSSQGGNMIGEGGFGTVYLGRFSDGHECAIKKLKQSVFQCSDVELLKQYQNELQMLKRLKHPNLVELYGYSFDGPAPCLIFQFLRNGSLLGALGKDSSLHLPWESRVHIAQGTAEGLAYLHSEGVVHRDVKSANVLLDSDLNPKVADFGLVRAIPEGDKKTHITSMIIGTSIYMPPEARIGEVSPKGDSFSFGVVLLELITGLEPLDENREGTDIITYMEVIIDKCGDILSIVDHRLNNSYNKASAKKMYDIASDCLEKKLRRPLLADVLPRLMGL
ncbi:interleukin-1 receptor-associated kinase 4-like [Acanthaster planci]|uniref:non-specific serine/threonine protein kinase n=1 Tax=Acanthaster planci TaxID=133434 RepID=A0A8B7Z0U7_ACAPL|nr:interleukin-1 receptor-associated kinase 4-like [Acanthaster planci]XP_022099213.1 interleukin-1 receptor-associated kinase 4-like [Acanthaster planci]XP_022099220.1 interleukin-1 receptor-associated kinase 4-like [Acanthaster planci]XP_022099228.1 interleukin-1 receptor-associated kinase 4-like [Acanthaster planci]